MPALGVMFHHFYDARHPAGQGAIGAPQLDEIIRRIGPRRILPAREWFERAAAGRLGRQDVCLTFDDNLRCQFDVALPVLRAWKLTAFWFICTGVFDGRPPRLEIYRAFRTRCYRNIDDFYADFFRFLATSSEADEVAAALERFCPEDYLRPFAFYSEADRRFRFVRDEVLGPQRYERAMEALMACRGVRPADLAEGLWMDDACLRTLADEGHVLGLHSHTHPTRLADLPARRQLQEYRDNCMTLLRITGRRPECVSHPCNSYNADTLALLTRLGVRVGFRANAAQDRYGPLEHPRIDAADILQERLPCGSPSSPETSPVTSH